MWQVSWRTLWSECLGLILGFITSYLHDLKKTDPFSPPPSSHTFSWINDNTYLIILLGGLKQERWDKVSSDDLIHQEASAITATGAWPWPGLGFFFLLSAEIT